MISEQAYDILALPVPPSPSNIRKYRDIRLTALRTDSASFTSTYEREAAFSEATGRSRLKGDGKATFVARPRAARHNGPGGRVSGAAQVPGEEDTSFVGTVTVIAARVLPSVFLPDDAGAESAYVIFGMWVSPEHRRKGIARRLLETAFAWADAESSRKALDPSAAGRGSDLFMVGAENESGRRLYEWMGFETLAVDGEGGREVWMRRRM